MTHDTLDARLRAIGEVASAFAHDFNNALNSIGLWIARIDRAGTDVDRRKGLDALERLVRETAVIVGQLEEFAGKREDAPIECLDVAGAVAAAASLYRSQLIDRHRVARPPIALDVRIPEGLPAVCGIDVELRQVFANILFNARDAMVDGGVVRISAEQRGDEVVMRFEDDGPGIAEEDLVRVFDPFFSTKRGRGTGLGLSIAHGVMRRLGGRIVAANGRRGGAVFTLTFPIADAPSADELEHDRFGGVSRHRVLVVDDDADNLEVIGLVLEGLGQEAVSAQSGPDALASFERGERYDLVLCDIGMPEMDGWAVAERLRELAPETPVYMVTGWAHEIPLDDPRRGLVAGVFPKPLEVDALERLVRRVGESRVHEVGNGGGDA